MHEYKKNEISTVQQAAKRACYDAKTIHDILDTGYVAHVSFIYDSRPVVIPVYYVRDGESILLHGSRKTRLFRALADGRNLCLSVAILDGLVMAKSAFHHSMNYRSVIIHSSASVLAGEEKAKAADLLIDRLETGRSDKVRKMNRSEDKATTILRIGIANVSAKIRTGGPNEAPEDMDLPVWSGVRGLNIFQA